MIQIYTDRAEFNREYLLMMSHLTQLKTFQVLVVVFEKKYAHGDQDDWKGVAKSLEATINKKI